MAPPKRVVLAFDPQTADHASRQVLSGIHRWAEEHPGQWLLVHDPHPTEKSLAGCRGMIGAGSDILEQAAVGAGVLYVATDDRSHSVRVPRVMDSCKQAGTLAADHLVRRGYAHFAYLGYGRNWRSYSLEAAFRSALRARGQGIEIRVHTGISRRHASARRRAFYESLGRWLDELPKPVGILAGRDSLALGLAEQCLTKGIRIPEEVGLIGAGNDPVLCLTPPVHLSSVDFAHERVGHEAAALLDRLANGAVPPARNVIIPPVLVARASTGRADLSDHVVAKAVAYIAEHAHAALRAADVADAVGVSQRQLLRRFRLVRRRSIAQEIARARLRHAEDILQHTPLSVGAAARAAGFKTPAHLTHLFKEHHGTTPGRWRRGRPTPPPYDPADLEHAKRFLEATGLPIDVLAEMGRFPNADAFRAAFAGRYGCLPDDYREKYRREHPPEPPRVEVVFDEPPPGAEDSRRWTVDR